MKTTPVCPILASLLALSPLLSAEERAPGGERGRPTDRPSRGADMWKQVDRDGDGAISQDEFGQMPRVSKLPEDQRQALFDRLDKNGDGQIDRSEMHQGKPGPGQRRPEMPRIWELDANKDGGVSFDEFQAGRMVQRLDPDKQKHLFNRLDSNGDGKISPADKPKPRERPEDGDRPQRPEGGDRPRPGGDDRKPQPGGMIQQLDKDGDGSLSFEEFSNGPRASQLDQETLRERFNKMDRNGDGKIDRGDMQRREGQRPRPRSGGPGAQEKPDGDAKIE